MKTRIWLAALVSLLLVSLAGGWSVTLFTDSEVVGRAELIVVARVKQGSIKKIMREGRAAYEHRAVLVISRVLKGESHEKELSIMIHYGLLPVSARYEKNMSDGDATISSPPEVEGETCRIYEANPSEGFFRPSGDVHQEQIWLLRHHRIQGHQDEEGNPSMDHTDLPGV